MKSITGSVLSFDVAPSRDGDVATVRVLVGTAVGLNPSEPSSHCRGWISQIDLAPADVAEAVPQKVTPTETGDPGVKRRPSRAKATTAKTVDAVTPTPTGEEQSDA